MAETTVTNPQTPAWLTGAEPELIGHVQNRKWDTLTSDQAALEGVRAHFNSEKMLGVPAERVIKLPANADDKEGWAAAYSKLGAETDPKNYDFAGLKFKDGTEVPKQLEDTLRALAFANHLSKDAAKTFAQSILKTVDDIDDQDAVINQGKATEQMAKLKTNWPGDQFNLNMALAKDFATKLGPQYASAVTALEGQVGYADVMSLFHRLGTGSSEAPFHGQGKNPGVQNLTRDQAVAKKNSLKQDPDFIRRWHGGGAAEGAEMLALNGIIAAQD